MGGVLRGDREEKHESGYRVTAQTVRIDELGVSLDDEFWMKRARREASRRVEKMAMILRRRLGGFGVSEGFTLL